MLKQRHVQTFNWHVLVKRRKTARREAQCNGAKLMTMMIDGEKIAVALCVGLWIYLSNIYNLMYNIHMLHTYCFSNIIPNSARVGFFRAT